MIRQNQVTLANSAANPTEARSPKKRNCRAIAKVWLWVKRTGG